MTALRALENPGKRVFHISTAATTTADGIGPPARVELSCSKQGHTDKEADVAIVIGCDMHTRFQQLAVIDTATGEVVEEARLENEPEEGVKAWYGKWAAPATVAVEATGYLRWFLELMAPTGHELLLGDAARLRAMVVRKQKTDRNDALHLAEICARGLFPRVWVASPEVWETRHLLRHRDMLVKMRRQAKQAVQSLALGRGLRLRQALFTRKGRERLAGLALPPLEADRLRQSLELVDEFGARVRAMDAALESRAAASARAARLRTHPGVGPVTALAWECALGDLSRFACSAQVVSYIGLNPSEYSSGGRQKLGRISKQGSPFLRRMLVEAAAVAARLDPELHRFYARKAAAKSRARARVAVARKLAVRLYWMERRGQDYPALWGDAHADRPGSGTGLKAMAGN